MTIPNPTLDDVTFDELLNNARKNIAIFSKQWTNYNESDPGITLLELLCWLVDNQTYSLNRITKKNYKKFLKLLGDQPKIRHPAKYNASFTGNNKVVTIPAKTTLVNSIRSIDDRDNNKEDITLEIDKKLDVIPIVMRNISVISNFGISDKTELLSKKPISCFGDIPRINNTFLLGLDTNYNKKTTLNIFFELEHDNLDTYPFGEHCNNNQFFLSSELEWRYSQKGISVYNWPPLKVVTDDTNSLTKDGLISLEIPFDKMSADDIHKTNNSLCWVSCTLKNGSFEIPPKIKSIYLNSVSAKQHRTTTETIGKSNGWPNQYFTIPNKPLFDVLQVHVSNNTDDHNDAFEEIIEWKRIDDFDTSGPDDLHYVVDYDAGSIVFGNGFHGDIPSVDSKIIVSYTYGKTNDEHLDTKDSVMLKLSDNKKYSNIKNINAKLIAKSSSGETIQDATARVRKEMQIPFKTINGYDYEYIAKNTPGIRVARVFALPDEPNNEITIVAVPYSPLPNPIPSKGFLQTLSAHIEKHRPLTTKISVIPPNYIEISISTSVTIDKRANEKTIKENILYALNSFLSPIGENEGGGWKVGRPVYRSELYAIIKEIEGVIHVSPPYITASGQNNTFRYTNDMIWIDRFSLVYPGVHSVVVEYEHSKNMMIEEDKNTNG